MSNKIKIISSLLIKLVGFIWLNISQAYSHQPATTKNYSSHSLSPNTAGVNNGTKLHYLGNEAVLVDDQRTKLLFDPFFHNHYGHYQLVPESITQKVFANQPPFDKVNAIFVSHVHGDHFDSDDTMKYLLENSTVMLFISEQGRRILSADINYSKIAKQVRSVDIKLGQTPVSFALGSFEVEAVYIPHAGWPQRKDIQNIVFRVTTGSSFTVAHFGDADANPEFYQAHGSHWSSKATDVALVPYWLGLTPSGKKVINSIINSSYNLGVHVPVKGHPALPTSGLDYFNTPGETRTFPSSDQ